MSMRLRRGQAMVESVFAVLVISLIFFGLFYLSHLLTVKILLDHAAARAARARAVGLNDFMCRKAARVAVTAVAGECRWPDYLDRDILLQRLPRYMESRDEAEAAGCLDFEYWYSLEVKPGEKTKVRMGFECLDMPVALEGDYRIESHYREYLIAP